MNSLGLGHPGLQVDAIRCNGGVQLVHVVAVPEQVVQELLQALQILPSDISPNSFELVQLKLHVFVVDIPQ